MNHFRDIPNPVLVIILQFLGKPEDFSLLFSVGKSFNERFDVQDRELWGMISSLYNIRMPRSGSPGRGNNRSLRSRSNYRRLFFTSYYKYKKQVLEKHDMLVLFSKELLEKKTDKPQQLRKLITKFFPDIYDLNPNWQCLSFENNTILTLAARYCHLKSMKLLVESYSADMNVGDMGGFTPLILCAFCGFMEGVQYCIKKGADIYCHGRLRSGASLTAEHWAACQGHLEIFYYLRSIRLRDNRKKTKVGNGLNSAVEELVVSVGEESQKDMIASSTQNRLFNYDSATFDEIFFLGHNPTTENLQQLPSSSSGCFSSTALKETISQLSDGSSSSISGDSTSSSYVSTAKYDGSFCICGRGFVGNMIACEMTGCEVEWFHFECVGLTKEVRCI
jgi:hypothetical protein